MRHLIIGYGNMGKRHGDCLRRLGDTVETVDLGDNLEQRLKENFHDSVLLCTPAATHAELIEKVLSFEKPLFVEKPVAVDLAQCARLEKLEYRAKTMVACNWRFCDCMKFEEIKHIAIDYPAIEKLDMIHFVDLFWERWGKPDHEIQPNKNALLDMTLFTKVARLRVELGPKNLSRLLFLRGSTILNEKQLVIHHCDMFFSQLKSWRDARAGRMVSINPLPKAIERTKWLLEKLEAR